MLVKKVSDRSWQPADQPGIERRIFRTNDTGGRSLLVRLKAGSRVLRHTHGGTEEVVVLAGKVSIGGVDMEEGDYMYVTAGEEHDVVGVTDATIFVSSQKASRVVET